MAYPFALNPGALNIQTGLNVQGGLNVQPNAQPPGSFYPTTWPFSQPTGPTPVFGGLFSPQNLNVQSGLNVQNAPTVQDLPMHTNLPTGNDWLGAFGHAWTAGVGDIFNASGIPTAGKAWWSGVNDLNPFGGGSSAATIPPGLAGPSGTPDPAGTVAAPAGPRGALTGKATTKKTTPAKTISLYTPLVWTDVHTPLPTYTAPPGYVKPDPFVSAAYQQPYTKAGLASEAKGYRNIQNTWDRYYSDVNKLKTAISKLPELEPRAHARAVQDINIMVKNIVGQQKMLMAQGQYNARAISGAGAAAVNLEKGIGDIVGRDVAGMAATTRLLGQGVGGALTGQAASDLARIAGATPVGQLSSQLVGGIPTGSFPLATGNAVSQIQGEIPGQGLSNQVRPAAEMSASLAQLIQGGAQVAGQGAIAAGNQAANNLQPQITAAQNQLPTLTNQYLDTLTTQRQNEINNQLTFLTQTGQISVEKAKALSDQINTRIAQEAQNAQGFNAWSLADASGRNAYSVGDAANRNSYNAATTSAQNSFAIARAGIEGQDLRTNAQGRISIAAANASAIRSAATTLAAQIRANAALAAGKRAAAKDLDAKAAKMADLATGFAMGTYTKPSNTRGGAGALLVDQPIPPQDAVKKMVARYPSLAATKGGMDLILYSLSVAYGPMKIVQTTDENGKPTAVSVGWPPNSDFNTYNAIQAWPVSSDQSGPVKPVTG